MTAADINESVVLEFAQEIKEHGFNNSQLEIDDKWESCYGDTTFDPEKFPDPAGLVSGLQAAGFRVTLWIHPFINAECVSYATAAFPPNMFLVRDSKTKYISKDGIFGGGGQFGDWEAGLSRIIFQSWEKN